MGTVQRRTWHASYAGFRLVDDIISTTVTIIVITDIHSTMCIECAGCFVHHVWGQPRPSLKPLVDVYPVRCSRLSSVFFSNIYLFI